MRIRNYEDFEDYIDHLMAQRESDVVEFKSAKGGFPASFWETYSAFANTEGGTIVLGVKEKEDEFVTDDLTQTTVDKYKKELWDNLHNTNTVNKCILTHKDLIEASYHGHALLLVCVPMAERTDRPIYHGTNPLNGTYRRDHEGDYRCTNSEVSRMFADADDNRPADSRILHNYTMDDLDRESLRQYRQIFSNLMPDHPWLVLDDIAFLTKLGGYRKDRKTSEEGFTKACLLMFGKTDSITDNECAPNFFVDYRHTADDAPENQRWSDRIYPDGMWEANLFQFYRRVSTKLNTLVPKPFSLQGDTRIDDTPTHEALREAFVNCLIHADYSVDASIVVSRTDTQVIFSNPGTLLVSKHQYYTGGESVCRNKSLQRMFSFLGRADKAGSGVDKILQGWERHAWRKPLLLTKNRPDKVELVMSTETMLPEPAMHTLQNMYGSNVANLEHERLVVLTTAYTHHEVTNEMMRPILNKHRVDITALLRQMCNERLILSYGHGRGTKYKLNEYYLNTNDASSRTNDASSRANDASSRTNDASSRANDASLTDKMGREAYGENVAGELQSKKRLSKRELFLRIHRICQDYTSLEDIAEKTQRSASYLKDHIIKEMVQKNYLDRLYPETPRHPHQKYISVRKVAKEI